MKGRLFGTDGVRGRANSWPMTADLALQLGQIAGLRFGRTSERRTVLIGKDTRLSGYMIEGALVSGFTSVGVDVVLTGPLPTPAVGMLTRSMQASLGVMISASHNPFHDNGIKLFGPDGYKLSDADEDAMEAEIGDELPLADPARLGRVIRIEEAVERYVAFAKGAVPTPFRLDGMRIVVDAANGAAFRAAPALMREFGAEVIEVASEPDGLNINAGCGSTAPEGCCEAVRKHGAVLGVALDGDADRVVLVDERGRVVDGDQLMALIAEEMMARGALAHGTVVATVMSNAGLERHLKTRGINLVRTKVGDRHVVERMRLSGCNLGGEQSGHIILGDYATTGDGLIAALQALAAIAKAGRPASEVLRRFEPLPQVRRDVPIPAGTRPLEQECVRCILREAEAELGRSGRLVVRSSGTEPVIRVMAEGEDVEALNRLTDAIEEAVTEASLRQDRDRSWRAEFEAFPALPPIASSLNPLPGTSESARQARPA